MSAEHDSKLRKLVKVLLEDKTLGPAMVKVNPVVDLSAAVTNPENQDFKPQNSIELKIALNALADQVSDDSAHSVYDSIQHAMKVPQEDEEMKDQENKIEETIRLVVRKLIQEAIPTLPRPKFIPPTTPPAKPAEDPALAGLTTADELVKYFKSKKFSAADAKEAAQDVLKKRFSASDAAARAAFTGDINKIPAGVTKASTTLSPDEKRSAFEKSAKSLQPIFNKLKLPGDKASSDKSDIAIENALASAMNTVTESDAEAFANAYNETLEKNKDLPPYEIVQNPEFKKSFKDAVGTTYQSYVEELGYKIFRAIGASGEAGKRGYNKALAKSSAEISSELDISPTQVNKDVNTALGKAALERKASELGFILNSPTAKVSSKERAAQTINLEKDVKSILDKVDVEGLSDAALTSDEEAFQAYLSSIVSEVSPELLDSDAYVSEFESQVPMHMDAVRDESDKKIRDHLFKHIKSAMQRLQSEA